MFRRKKKPLAANQPSSKSAWIGDHGGFETVVFVHGILGSHGTTWGKFPDLLHSDPDLPKLDILSWGYKSGLVPSSYQDVETEGQAFISDLEIMLDDCNRIYVVGHSMGGLVVLKGLVNRIRDQAADEHPVSNVHHITLYSCPLHGSACANVVAFMIGLNRWSRLISRVLPRKQLRDLQRGKFVADLMAETNDLIYRPPADSKLVQRSIKVRACVAKHDAIVSTSSAIGLFRSAPPPIYLVADHQSVKQPEHHGDQRYLAFKKDLEEALTEPFSQLCQRALKADTPHERRMAAERFDRQYGEMAKLCAIKCKGGRNVTGQDLYEVVPRIWEFGAQGDTTPTKAITHVVLDFQYRDDPRLKL